jgi:hypothetical protein
MTQEEVPIFLNCPLVEEEQREKNERQKDSDY